MSRPDAEMPARGSRSHKRLCGRLLCYADQKILIRHLTQGEREVGVESIRRCYLAGGGNRWESPRFVEDLVQAVRVDLGIPYNPTTEQLMQDAIKTVEQMSPAEKVNLRQRMDEVIK